jgi:hypothetical protein
VGMWVCGCVGVGGWVGVYTKSKSSELSPLRRKMLCFAKQFPPPLRSKNYFCDPMSIIIKNINHFFK